jgi:hypothetical protein
LAIAVKSSPSSTGGKTACWRRKKPMEARHTSACASLILTLKNDAQLSGTRMEKALYAKIAIV